jgi:hypothetical protein
MAFYLPGKVPSYLIRLSHNYATDSRNAQLKAVLDSARVFVAEGVDYDNYNGGMDGHGVILFLPLEILGPISPQDQKRLIDKLSSDLRAVAGNAPGEFLSYIQFELNDDNDESFKKSFPISRRPQRAPDSLNIWKPDMIRVFVTHRDQYKATARELADALEPFGFTCFVAHDTITPMAEWRLEIMKGLQTMDILLVFLTDDFHDSIWTDQEVGFALGDAKPVIPVKLGTKDPQGFISHLQALNGAIDDPKGTAELLVPLLADAAKSKDRIQTAVVRAFTESPDWGETTKRFNRMKKLIEVLTDKELQMIVDTYAKNDQLHGASYLNNNHARLKNFLANTTGKTFRIEGNKVVSEKNEEKIPF